MSTKDFFNQHFDSLKIEKRQRLAVIILNRQESRNSLSKQLVKELREAFQSLLKENEIRAVILTGVGDRAFCAGADLKERKGMDEVEVHDFLNQMQGMFTLVDSFPKPILACINGAALGGGFELALACDFRIANQQAVVGLPEVSLAIIPGAGGTQRLTKIVGPAAAKELILLSKKMNTDEALRLGLLSKVVQEGEDLIAAGEEWLKPILEGAPVAISAALDAIDFAQDGNLKQGLVFERKCYERTLKTEDRIEALKAFSEKRKPVFTGK